MSARIVLIGAIILLLAGCATYDNGYRDGAYYRPNHSGDGDYYYGRPQQRERGYYDPFYSPFYGPYYGPYSPSHYYPYYGPYRPYRSGFGFEYNYGNGGYGGYGPYGGYGYPMFGLGYTYFGGDRHRRDDDHGRDRDRDRDWSQDRDRDRDHRADHGDNRPRPYVSASAPWNRSSYRMGSPGERVRTQAERRDIIERQNASGAAHDSRAQALRLPSDRSAVVDMRRVEQRRQGGDYRRDERASGPVLRAPISGRSPVSQPSRATPSRPNNAYRAPVSRPMPVDREPMRTESLEKSRDRSQNRTSKLEKER